MGRVELSVSDLERSLEYWQRAIGLRVLERDGGVASLGADTELVRLVEEPGATSARGYAGLYHVALLLPSRRDLARWLASAAQSQVPLEGLSDHAVSEAIYLRDPDQHGIEIYADRPRELWDGRVMELMISAASPRARTSAMSSDAVPAAAATSICARGTRAISSARVGRRPRRSRVWIIVPHGTGTAEPRFAVLD